MPAAAVALCSHDTTYNTIFWPKYVHYGIMKGVQITRTRITFISTTERASAPPIHDGRLFSRLARGILLLCSSYEKIAACASQARCLLVHELMRVFITCAPSSQNGRGNKCTRFGVFCFFIVVGNAPLLDDDLVHQ